MQPLRARAPGGVRHARATFALLLVLVVPAESTVAADTPAKNASAEPVPASTLVDGFEDIAPWTATPASGVVMKLSSDRGEHGNAIRVDVDFQKGGGYAVLHRKVDLDLPANYRFSFRVRGAIGPENLEFKLIDSTGDNVWWQNRRDFAFASDWQTVAIRKRNISFAWGPLGGGELSHVAALEFAITAGSGGKGTVWIDELRLEPLAVSGTPAPIRALATSSRPGHDAALAVDGDSTTAWESVASDVQPRLTLAFGGLREFSAIQVDWVPGRRPSSYFIEVSTASSVSKIYRDSTSKFLDGVFGRRGDRDWLFVPESEARWIRVHVPPCPPSERIAGVAIREIRIMPVDWAPDRNAFEERLAVSAPRGWYPRMFRGEQSYWTVVGEDGGREKALLGEDGALEAGNRLFSIEPFLGFHGRVITWADVRSSQRLAPFPFPEVRWDAGQVGLRVSAFPIGHGTEAAILARYRIQNHGNAADSVRLYLALRPYQVNPPTQFLSKPGGVAQVGSMRGFGGMIRVNGGGGREFGAVSLTPAHKVSVVRAEDGELVELLTEGRLLSEAQWSGSTSHSGVYAYRLSVPAHGEREVDILVPREPDASALRLETIPTSPLSFRPAGIPIRTPAQIAALEDSCAAVWRRRLAKVSISLPGAPAGIARTLDAQVAWMRIERDSAGLQPGTRAYDRTWIRDGALMSSVLLRMGQEDAVREFIDWFAPYQYADGKVPCCVDARGADPVPEYDSDGEFIWLVAEYYRFTGDRALLERHWPAVRAAAGHLDRLRMERRTPEWRSPGKEPFFGILPPSISHEGYSAKAQHSYWDDLFALRGLRDATWLAGELGMGAVHDSLAAIRDTFTTDVAASVRAAMAAHQIDYVPGSADLGDFDATSTTIALTPVQAGDVLPSVAIERTFDKYWEFFRERRDSVKSWDAFTPYEMRAIGSFVRLGQRERANALLEYFIRYRRPIGWEQWPEVVWRDERAPHFLGDLPHAWVGSDFVRSVLDMLAYDRESDQALVLAAGVTDVWMRRVAVGSPAVAIQDLRTRWGSLSYRMSRTRTGLAISIDRGLRVPSGGIVISAPGVDSRWKARVNGNAARVNPAGEVVVRSLPARVELTR